MTKTLLCIFQVLFGPQTSGGGSGPWHAETSDGQGLQQLPKQNGEDINQSLHIYTVCLVVLLAQALMM